MLHLLYTDFVIKIIILALLVVPVKYVNFITVVWKIFHLQIIYFWIMKLIFCILVINSVVISWKFRRNFGLGLKTEYSIEILVILLYINTGTTILFSDHKRIEHIVTFVSLFRSCLFVVIVVSSNIFLLRCYCCQYWSTSEQYLLNL